MNLDPFASAQKKLDNATTEAEKVDAAKHALRIGIICVVAVAILGAIGLFLLFAS